MALMFRNIHWGHPDYERQKKLKSYMKEKSTLRTLIPFPTRPSPDDIPPHIHSLTKNVHTLLPRELRDIIYTHLLEPRDIEHISSCASPRLDRFPYIPGKEPHEYLTHPPSPAPKLPPYADTKIAYPDFVKEILSMVYELHPEMWIDYPSAIPSFLTTDFWHAGVMPCDSRLNVVHVSGLLDAGYHNSINISTLASDLALLLECKRQRQFNLDVVFRTELGVTIFDRGKINGLAGRIHAIWRIMREFVAQAEKAGVSVAFILLTRRTMYSLSTEALFGDLEGDRAGGFETEAEWETEIITTLSPLCYGVYLGSLFEVEPRRYRRNSMLQGIWGEGWRANWNRRIRRMTGGRGSGAFY